MGTEINTNTATQNNGEPQIENTQERETVEAKSEQADIAELTESDFNKLAKLKIYGKEEKIPLKQLIADAQKVRAAEKKWRESAKQIEQMQQLEKLIQQNPKELLRHYGHDLDKMAEEVINEQLKVLQMDETTKKQYELERQLNQERILREKLEQEKQSYAEAQLQSQVNAHIDQEHAQALKELNLPPNKYLIKRAAHEQYVSMLRGEPLTAKDAYGRIINEFVDDFRHYAKAVGKDAQTIRSLLGDEIVKTLLDAEVKRVTEKTAPNIQSLERSGTKEPVPSHTKKKSYLTEREWREWQSQLSRQS